jgi:co-chaperonin GroES (HSP10)
MQEDSFLTAYRAVQDILPMPTGCKVLIGIPKLAEKTASGVMLPDELIKREEAANTIAKVCALGPDAYLDQKMFPNGAYCKVGDWVVMRPYSGTRFTVEGCEHEFRLVNDNTIEGVVKDPYFIMRAHSIVKLRIPASKKEAA